MVDFTVGASIEDEQPVGLHSQNEGGGEVGTLWVVEGMLNVEWKLSLTLNLLMTGSFIDGRMLTGEYLIAFPMVLGFVSFNPAVEGML
jgi:hypothetical protein